PRRARRAARWSSRAARRARSRRARAGRSPLLRVEHGGRDVGGLDMLAAGSGGGEERAGGVGVDLAGDSAAVLEELVEGGCAERALGGADGAHAALDVLGRLSIGEGREGGADGDALRERG